MYNVHIYVHIHVLVFKYIIVVVSIHVYPHYRSGRVQVVRLLIDEYDCSLDVRDNGGRTPLHYACR